MTREPSARDGHAAARIIDIVADQPRLRHIWRDDQVALATPCGDAICFARANRTLHRVDPDPARLAQTAAATGIHAPIVQVPRAMVYQAAGDRLWLGSPAGWLAGFATGRRLQSIASHWLQPGHVGVLALAVSGSTVLALDGRAAVLYSLTVADGRVTRRGHYLLQGRAVDVALDGNLAFVAEYPHGIQVLDVGEPDRPELLATRSMAPAPRAIAVAPLPGGDVLVAMAHGAHGIGLYRWWREHREVTPLAHSNTADMASDVAIRDNALWVADGTQVLVIEVPEKVLNIPYRRGSR